MTKFLFSRWIALPVLAGGMYWALLLAWADHLGHSGSVSGRARAVRLAPYSASLWERLANKQEETGDNPLPALERAAILDPANAGRFERLGQRAEVARDFRLSEASLLQAAALSRLYQPRYLLAQYYFRRHNALQWERWTREALAVAYGDVTPLIELIWQVKPDGDSLVRQSVAERPAIARQFLSFLLPKNRAAAAPLARHVAESGDRNDLPVIYRYCDETLARAESTEALQVWNTLCRRKLLPDPPLDPKRGVSLTNGDFAHRAVGAGFDWHLEPAAGIRTSQPASGLRITLSGDQPENSLIAWQYIPMRRGAWYRLHVTGAVEGIGWTIFTPSANGWREQEVAPSLEFQAPSELVRLVLMYRGPHGSTRLAAEVLITRVRLEMQL